MINNLITFGLHSLFETISKRIYVSTHKKEYINTSRGAC